MLIRMADGAAHVDFALWGGLATGLFVLLVGIGLLTYALINVTWVFFRSQNFGTTLILLKKLFLLDRTGAHWFG